MACVRLKACLRLTTCLPACLLACSFALSPPHLSRSWRPFEQHSPCAAAASVLRPRPARDLLKDLGLHEAEEDGVLDGLLLLSVASDTAPIEAGVCSLRVGKGAKKAMSVICA